MSTGRSPDSWRAFIEAQAGTRQDSADEMGGAGHGGGWMSPWAG